MLGKLSAVAMDAIGRHIETCSVCQEVLDTLDALEDSVVADLKAPGHAMPPDAQLESQIQRAEEISRVVWQRPKPEIPEEPPPPRLGQYEILERIGRGGMGTVYKAMHTRLKRPVALKLLPRDRTQAPEALTRFQREMEAVGRLDHPHLVRAHDAGEADGQQYLVMEFLDGIDLARLVRRSGPLSISDACEAIRQAALGLQHAHEHGLVHRDVKPSNLMLTISGQVKVLDMGLARLTEKPPSEDEMTASGRVVGTGDFIAPEQGEDTRQADARSDIYALGCTLYFLLVGRAPFSGSQYGTFVKKVMAHTREPIPPIRSVRQDVPESLAVLLDRMTAKDPAARFQTAAEVAEALSPFAKGSDLKFAVSEEASKLPESRQSARPRRNAKGIRLQGVILLFGLIVAGAYAYRGTLLSLLGDPADLLKTERSETQATSRSPSPPVPQLDRAEFNRIVTVDAEAAKGQEESNRDLAEMQRDFAEVQQDLDRDLAEMQDDLARDFGAGDGNRRKTRNTAAQSAAAQHSEGFDNWLVAGPFLYDSLSEAYDAEHVIEKEPIDRKRLFNTREGQRGWRRFEAPPDAESRIVLTETAGRAPPAGRVGVYFAVCWAKFPGNRRSVDLRFLASCPYKLWINRTPAKGSPVDGGNFGGGILSHGGKDGWNELLFKFVVATDRKTPADFRLRLRRPQDKFGRPIEQAVPSITVEPPAMPAKTSSS